MSWQTRRIGRVDPAEEACACDARPHAHAACYRAEAVNRTTGEVRTGWLCTARAATVAAQSALAFPPGRWERVA